MICTHFERCSGCSVDLKKENYNANSPIFAEAAQFFEDHGIQNFELKIGALKGFRTRIKLAIRGSVGKVKIGMFEGHSHQVLEIPHCQVQHPSLNQMVLRLQQWLNEQAFSAYQELQGQGLFRYLQLTISASKKIQVVFVLNQEGPIEAKLRASLDSFWLQHQASLHSIWLNFNTRRDNVIFGESWTLFSGEPWFWESFLGREIAFHPASFMQANPEMFEQLLHRLQTWVPQESSIAEFYAGGGTIGLTLLDKAKRIDFNEISPLAKSCFEVSCSKLPDSLKHKLSFSSGRAEDSTILNQGDIDIVIVDPPRKGLDLSLREKILKSTSVQRLIYVSCGFESFKRDTKNLEKGGFELEFSEAFLFFPGTDHLEVLAVFKRSQ